MGEGTGRPLVLVTGFGSFPGAPVNPTAALIAELAAQADRFDGTLRTAIFDVDYQSLPARLAELSSDACADVAIHFGLSASAQGFVLERVARNAIRANSPDNAGFQLEASRICDGDDEIHSSLPLEDIHKALEARDIPVGWSDDAGGYLCNFLFYHARSGLCPTYVPEMAGFIHVPPFPDVLAPYGLPLPRLVEGATAIVRTSIDVWQSRQTGT